MTLKVAVLGAGAWGTALTIPLAENSSQIVMWDRVPNIEVSDDGVVSNPSHLPGVVLSPKLAFTHNICEAIDGAAVVLFAVPTHATRQVAASAREFMPRNTIILSVAKGIEPGTHMRMTQVIAEEMPDHPKNNLACLSGPNFAVEVARGEPSATVIGTPDTEVGAMLQDLLMTGSFRIYTNPDVAGVELGGALKNIIALAVGICEGMGLGYNSRAAVITRGITEITRLGLAMGCQPLTFAGLSGLGDLVLTCTGAYSRNRQCGLAIGSGESLEPFLKRTSYTVEGIRTTQAAVEIARTFEMELPITEQVYEILFNNKPPRDGIRALMTRGRKHEIEEVVRYR